MSQISKPYDYTRLRLLPILIFALIVTNSTAFFLSRLYLAIISVSRSSFKSYLFCVLLFLIFHFWNRPRPSFVTPRFRRNFVFLTIALFGLSIFELFYVYGEFGLFPLRTVGFLSHGDYSHASLYHNHFGKVFLAFFSQFIDHQQFIYNYDSGLPFLAYIPKWLIYLHVVLGVLFILGFLFTMPRRRELPPGWSLVVCISSLIIFKVVFDGGIFCTEAAIAFCIFFCYHYYSDIPISTLSRKVLFLILCNTLLVFSIGIFNGVPIKNILLGPVPLLTLGCTLYCVDLKLAQKSVLIPLSLISLFVVAYYVYVVELGIYTPFAKFNYEYGYKKIEKGQTFVITVNRRLVEDLSSLRVVESVHGTRMHYYKIESLVDQNLKDLTQLGLNYNFSQLDRVGVDCLEGSGYQKHYYVIFPDQDTPLNMTQRSGDYLGVMKWKFTQKASNLYRLDIDFRGCIPGHLDWTLDLFHDLYLEKAIFIRA